MEPKEVTLGAGRVLFKQGDSGSELYFIKEGRVDLIVRNEDSGAEAVVATAGPKSVIGTMAFLEGDPRSATALTKTEVKCVVVNQVQRERLLDQIPNWFRVVVKDLSISVRSLNSKVATYLSENETLRKRIEILEKRLAEAGKGESESQNTKSEIEEPKEEISGEEIPKEEASGEEAPKKEGQ